MSVMPAKEPYAQIRISLQDIKPEIWRRVEVPLGMNLRGCMISSRRSSVGRVTISSSSRLAKSAMALPAPGEDFGRKVLQAKSVKLASLVAKDIKHFDYIYDFGDNWRHTIEIESIGETDPKLWYPRFVDGARRGPPEDVGGFPGYYDFVDAVTDPRNPEHQTLIEWYGGSYDPDDPESVRHP